MHAFREVIHREYRVLVGATECADGVIRVSATCDAGGDGIRSFFRFSSSEPNIEDACNHAIRDLCSLIDRWRSPGATGASNGPSRTADST